MKKFIYMILASAVILSAGGCKKEPVNTPGTQQTEDTTFHGKTIGQWYCQPVSYPGTEIYVEFFTDDTFALYQKVDDSPYCQYKGTWSIDEDTHVISGKYNDGTPWAASYTVIYADKTMTWTSNDEYATEELYDRREIPSSVKNACITVVKSTEKLFKFLPL